MQVQEIRFSIRSCAAWAPGIETRHAWTQWAANPFRIAGTTEAPVRAMPSMLRRRAGFLGRMALEAAYECLGEENSIPTVFCSRHGEVARSVELLTDLAQGAPLSPAAFGLSVHNATGGLFAIARGDRSNNICISSGADLIEQGVIEASALLADGEPAVLLVAYDCPLPRVYASFEDEDSQPYAWAWVLVPANDTDVVSLSWNDMAAADPMPGTSDTAVPAGLQVLRFHLAGERRLQRASGGRVWNWKRHD